MRESLLKRISNDVDIDARAGGRGLPWVATRASPANTRPAGSPRPASPGRFRHVQRSGFQSSQRTTRVAVGFRHEQVERGVVYGELERSKAALIVIQSKLHDLAEGVGAQRLEDEDAHARQQSAVDFERGVLGRGADKG